MQTRMLTQRLHSWPLDDESKDACTCAPTTYPLLAAVILPQSRGAKVCCVPQPLVLSRQHGLRQAAVQHPQRVCCQELRRRRAWQEPSGSGSALQQQLQVRLRPTPDRLLHGRPARCCCCSCFRGFCTCCSSSSSSRCRGILPACRKTCSAGSSSGGSSTRQVCMICNRLRAQREGHCPTRHIGDGGTSAELC
jgi:hypothetical protein